MTPPLPVGLEIEAGWPAPGAGQPVHLFRLAVFNSAWMRRPAWRPIAPRTALRSKLLISREVFSFRGEARFPMQRNGVGRTISKATDCADKLFW